ncbi:metalloendopeptidase OMA1, mitochondrial-like [Vespa crabro]|uniref:metalloendopeptidase OMA1, mitochondrial-like n=1 Tax=Vespa crabro TaxID=7445 RepID=UPI001EFF989F|nr:metalloendopeptidase OMA1, mitochondrial-like [Vespa crabro]
MFWIQKAIKLRHIHYFKIKSMICIIPNHQSIRYSKICILRTELSLKQLKNINYQKICDFHTSSKLCIPPIFAVILRPILRLSAFILGRGIKRWWQKKSTKEQEQYKLLFRENRNIFLGSLVLLCLMFIVYYLMHIETDPITNRKRFIIFNRKEQAALGQLIFEMHLEEHKASLVAKDHPAYKRLIKIIENILVKNKDLISVEDKNWTLTIVDSPIKNAYVLPERNIFFFLGVLNIVDNDDQLSIILAHEMAHALLLHSVEQFSHALLIDVLMTIPILLLWASFPDSLAFFLHMIGQHIVNLLHNLPYSRSLENEADEVGLNLAAKACVDVREAVVFWGTMRMLSEMKLASNIVPWLSTHPAHGDREQSLNKKMTKAIELMKSSGCPKLNPIDPRKQFYERTLKDHEFYFKQKGIIIT